MADPSTDCAALQARLTELHTEFEGLWLQVSQGAAPTPRYRELRRILDDLRVQYRRECGEPAETTNLPRSITSDWRAG